MNIHHIDIDPIDRTITFKGGYTPTKGPLPSCRYELLGLWLYEDTLLKAVFKADRIPTQDGEPILHRYEGEKTVQPAQATYRYFTFEGHAGMILSAQACAKMRLEQVWHFLDREANMTAATSWCDSEQLARLEEVEDMLGQFGPTMILKEKQNHE